MYSNISERVANVQGALAQGVLDNWDRERKKLETSFGSLFENEMVEVEFQYV